MKKKIFALAFITSLSATLTSCEKTPMACFEMSTSNANVGQSVTFTSSCSMDAKTYTWDFGDGQSSTESNPSHSYSTAGNFTIKLMTMSGDKMDETSKTITIN